MPSQKSLSSRAWIEALSFADLPPSARTDPRDILARAVALARVPIELRERARECGNALLRAMNTDATETLRRSLWPEQREACEFMKRREEILGRGGLLCDECGAGKTLTLLARTYFDVCERYAATGRRFERGEDDPRVTLVVCETTVLYRWQAEIERVFGPTALVAGTCCTTGDGGGGSGTLIRDESDVAFCDVVLTTYPTLTSAAEAEDGRFGFLRRRRWRRVVADEANAFCNAKTNLFPVMNELKFDFSWFVTATPHQNDVSDLAAALTFVREPRSRRGSSVAGDWRNWLSPKARTPTVPEVSSILKSAMLRRTSRSLPEVAVGRASAVDDTGARSRPPAIEVSIVEIDFEHALERETYAALKRNIAVRSSDAKARFGGETTGMLAVEAIQRLRQACISLSLLPDGPKEYFSSKFAAVVRYLEAMPPDDKAAVFSKRVRALEELRKHLPACVGPVEERDLVTGKLAPIERHAAIRRYHEDPRRRMLLASQVGVTGISLTCANHVILLDFWWNPNHAIQFIGRVYRPPQRKDVHVSVFMIRDTVEGMVATHAARKLRTARELMGDDRNSYDELFRSRSFPLVAEETTQDDEDGDDGEEDPAIDNDEREQEEDIGDSGDEIRSRKRKRGFSIAELCAEHIKS